MTDKAAKTDTTSVVASPVAAPETAAVTDRAGKIKPRRLPKGERIHRRRLKQADRKPGAAGH